MKKLLIILFSSISINTLLAQEKIEFEEKRLLGIAGYGTFGTESDDLALANLSFRFGYFETWYFQIGARLDLGYSSEELVGFGRITVSDEYFNFLTGPYIRFQLPINSVVPFIEGSSLFGGNFGLKKSDTDFWVGNLLLSTGVDFYLKEDIAIELILDYVNVNAISSNVFLNSDRYLIYSVGIIHLF